MSSWFFSEGKSKNGVSGALKEDPGDILKEMSTKEDGISVSQLITTGEGSTTVNVEEVGTQDQEAANGPAKMSFFTTESSEQPGATYQGKFFRTSADSEEAVKEQAKSISSNVILVETATANTSTIGSAVTIEDQAKTALVTMAIEEEAKANASTPGSTVLTEDVMNVQASTQMPRTFDFSSSAYTFDFEANAGTNAAKTISGSTSSPTLSPAQQLYSPESKTFSSFETFSKSGPVGMEVTGSTTSPREEATTSPASRTYFSAKITPDAKTTPAKISSSETYSSFFKTGTNSFSTPQKPSYFGVNTASYLNQGALLGKQDEVKVKDEVKVNPLSRAPIAAGTFATLESNPYTFSTPAFTQSKGEFISGLTSLGGAEFKSNPATVAASITREVKQTEMEGGDKEYFQSQINKMTTMITMLQSDLAKVQGDLAVKTAQTGSMNVEVNSQVLEEKFDKLRTHYSEENTAREVKMLELTREVKSLRSEIERGDALIQRAFEQERSTLKRETEQALQAKFREMTVQLDSNMVTRSATDLQKVNQLEQQVRSNVAEGSNVRQEFQDTLKREVNILRSELEAQTKDRSRELTQAIEALRGLVEQGDSKVQKLLMDEQLTMKRQTELSLQDLKKELEDGRRDVVTRSMQAATEASDRLKLMMSQETARLNQQVNDVAGQHDALKGGIEVGLRQSRQDSETKLQVVSEDVRKAREELQSGTARQREFLTSMQEERAVMQREMAETKASMKVALDEALASERRSRSDAHAATFANMEQIWNAQLQSIELATSGKQADIKNLVADAEKRMQQAMVEVKKGMEERHNNAEDILKQLRQMQQTMQAELTIYKTDSDSRLNDTDAKVARAIAEAKAGLDGRHDQSQEVLEMLQTNLGVVQEELGRNKAAVQDADSKLQITITELKRGQEASRGTSDSLTGFQQALAELQSGYTSNGDTFKQMQAAFAELHADFAKFKSDSSRDMDVKLQHSIGELSGVSDSRHSNTEEIVRKLLSANAEIQGELQNLKNHHESKVQIVLSQLQGDLNTHKDENEGKIQQVLDAFKQEFSEKMQSGYSELQGVWATYKNDTSSAIVRAIAAERQQTDEALAKLQQGQLTLQAEMAKKQSEHLTVIQQANADIQASITAHKADNETRVQSADAKVQQALLALQSDNEAKLDRATRELRADMCGRIDFYDDGIERLRQGLADLQAEAAGRKDGLVVFAAETDAKVQEALQALKLEIFERNESQEQVVSKLKESHADVQAQLVNHKNSWDGILQQADAKVVQAMGVLKAEFLTRQDGLDAAIKKVWQAYEAQSQEWAETKGSLDSVLEDADAKVQQAMGGLKMDLVVRHEDLKLELADMKTSLDCHKDILSKDADEKVQRAMTAIRGEMTGRHDGYLDEIMRFKESYAEFIKTLSSFQGQNDAKFVEMDGKVQEAMKAFQVEICQSVNNNSETMQKVMEAHASIQQDLVTHKDTIVVEADNKVQKALQVLRGEIAGRHGEQDEMIKKLVQAHAEIQADICTRHEAVLQKLMRSHLDTKGDMTSQREAILIDVEGKMAAAIEQLKGDIVVRIKCQEEAMNRTLQAQIDIQAQIVNQKAEHTDKMAVFDGQMQQVARTLQTDFSSRYDEALRRLVEADEEMRRDLASFRSVMAGRMDGHNEAIQKMMSTHAEISKDVSSQRDLVLQDADAKLQQAATELNAILVTRNNDSAEAMKKGLTELQVEIAACKGDVLNVKKQTDAKLSELEAEVAVKMQQVTKDIQADIVVRVDGQTEVVQRMSRAHADMQGTLAAQKDSLLKDVDAKVQSVLREFQREFSTRYEGHNDTVQKLSRAHTDLQVQIESNASSLVRQAISDLRRELVLRISGMDEMTSKLTQVQKELQEEFRAHKGESESKLRVIDLRVQESSKDLQTNMTGRQKGNDEAVQQAMKAHADLQGTLVTYKQDAEAQIKQYISDLKVDMGRRQSSHDEVILNLKQAQAELQAEMASFKGESNNILMGADLKVQQKVRELQEEMLVRIRGNEETMAKLTQTHMDMQGDLANYKSVVVGRADGQSDQLQKLSRTYADLQGDLTSQKDTIKSMDAAIQQLKQSHAGSTATRLSESQAKVDDKVRSLTVDYNSSTQVGARDFDVDAKVQKATAELKAGIFESMQRQETKLLKAVLDLKGEFENSQSKIQVTVSSLQRAQSDMQEAQFRTERGVVDAGATSGSNIERVTSAISNMQRNLTSLDEDHKRRITELRDQLATAREDQERQMVQALGRLKSTLEVGQVELKQALDKKLSESLSHIMAEQAEIKVNVSKVSTFASAEQLEAKFQRLWEAVDTHSHDVKIKGETDMVATRSSRSVSPAPPPPLWAQSSGTSVRQVVVPDVFPMSARAETTLAAPAKTYTATPSISGMSGMVQPGQIYSSSGTTQHTRQLASLSTSTSSPRLSPSQSALTVNEASTSKLSGSSNIIAEVNAIMSGRAGERKEITPQINFAALETGSGAVEFLSIGGQQVAFYETSQLQSLSPVKLREHAMKLYGMFGAKIGRSVPLSDAELLEWIVNVQNVHMGHLRLGGGSAISMEKVGRPIFNIRRT